MKLFFVSVFPEQRFFPNDLSYSDWTLLDQRSQVLCLNILSYAYKYGFSFEKKRKIPSSQPNFPLRKYISNMGDGIYF